jgi:hypothetical protein
MMDLAFDPAATTNPSAAPRCRRVLEGQGLSGSLPTELGVLSQMVLLCVPGPRLAVVLSLRRQLTYGLAHGFTLTVLWTMALLQQHERQQPGGPSAYRAGSSHPPHVHVRSPLATPFSSLSLRSVRKAPNSRCACCDCHTHPE